MDWRLREISLAFAVYDALRSGNLYGPEGVTIFPSRT